ncbi:MAG: type II secretion system protein GspL [Desulfococcaceae bacterium]
MNRKIVGLDIRPDAVAAVVLRGGLRDRTVETAATVPLTAGANGEGLRDALARLRERVDMRDALCVAAFPPGNISFRNLKVPFSNARKISQILPFEIEPTLPYPVEDLVLDFHPMGRNGDGGTEVFALAVEKDRLAEYLAALKSAGVDPHRVSAGGYSAALCAKAAGAESDGEPVLVLDVGVEAATLFLVIDEDVRLARALPLRIGQPVTGAALARFVRQTLTAYGDEILTDRSPAALFLTGAGSTDPSGALTSTLSETLPWPVQPLDLMGDGRGRVGAEDGVAWSPSQMNGALALALAEIDGKNGLNLRRGAFAARHDWSAHRRTFLAAGIFLTVILALLGLHLYLDTFALQKRLDRIDAQIHDIFRSTFPDVQRIVDPLHQMRVAMDELESPLPVSADGAGLRTIELLNRISGGIPESVDVVLTRTVVTPENVLISGNTDTFNSVDEIQNKLNRLEPFRRVTIISTAKDGNTNRIRFKMKADL